MGTVKGKLHDMIVNTAFSKFKEVITCRNAASRIFDLCVKMGETRGEQSE